MFDVNSAFELFNMHLKYDFVLNAYVCRESMLSQIVDQARHIVVRMR